MTDLRQASTMDDLKEGQNWSRSAMTITQDLFRNFRKLTTLFGTTTIGQVQFHKFETNPNHNSGH
jgi:hypothetical protein